MKIKEQIPFSTTLNKKTIRVLEQFCKTKGLKINYVVDTALIHFLEDEMDKMIIAQRADEEFISWKKHGS